MSVQTLRLVFVPGSASGAVATPPYSTLWQQHLKGEVLLTLLALFQIPQ